MTDALEAGSEAAVTNDERTIMTAEEFAHETDEPDDDWREPDRRHGRLLAVIWAPVVMLVLLGFFAMLASIVHDITREHDHEHAHQVSVWCYADPNRNAATSQLVGSAADVIGKCPDATVQGGALGGNP